MAQSIAQLDASATGSARAGLGRAGAFVCLAIAAAAMFCGTTAGASEPDPGQRRTLVVGGNAWYPPYEWLDEQGRPHGFNVDIMRALAARLNVDLEFRLTKWSTALELLSRREIDVIQGICPSPLRSRKYHIVFSEPHSELTYTYFVPDGQPPVYAETDLLHRHIAVQADDIMDVYLSGTPLADNVVRVDNFSGLLQRLAAGEFDCALLDRQYTAWAMRRYGITDISWTGSTAYVKAYGLGVHRDDEALLGQLNGALRAIRASGEYEQIYRNWFEPEQAVQRSMQRVWRQWILPGALAAALLLSMILLWNSHLRRKVEARSIALAHSDERFRRVFESTVDAVSIRRLADDVYVQVNAGFAALTGVPADAAVGRTPTDLELYIDAEVYDELRTALIHTQRVDNAEVAMRRRDGHLRSTLVSATVIDLDRVPHILSVTRDITERKEAEAERAQLEGQLRQAQKMEAVGRLAGGVAHDFNNLLTPILGYVELAANRIEYQDRVRDYLKQVQRAAERARSLTQQLLAFGRRQVLAMRPTNLNEVLSNSEKMLRRLVREDVQMELRLADELPLVSADPVQIDQILMNLVVNATDAMPDGGELQIATSHTVLDETSTHAHPDATPGPYVVLSVSDSGQGMDTETRARIFEPFFTTKQDGRGTGLGLSTVHGIVTQHGGAVWLYSEPGLGTTFKILLPAIEKECIVVEPEQPIEHVGGSETILIVEDDAVVREFAADAISTHGYHVTTASSGDEAIDVLVRNDARVDLLLTDVVMPQMNGADLVSRVRALRPEVKAVFMSGYSGDVIASRGVIPDSVHFIEKPFTARALVAKLREVLDEAAPQPRTTPAAVTADARAHE